MLLDDETRGLAFREAGKRRHPDAGGSAEDFERLKEAERVLADPGRRLRHWLELEGVPGEWRGAVSAGLMDVFADLGALLQRADGLLRERGKASSALAKAMLEGRVQAMREEMEGMQERLEGMVAERVAAFPQVERGERDGWELARELGFLGKWRGEVRERFAGLW